MPKKGQKSQRNTPEFYDEIKQNYSFYLTPTAINLLNQHAQALGISRSELIERIARKTLKIQIDDSLLSLLDS